MMLVVLSIVMLSWAHVSADTNLSVCIYSIDSNGDDVVSYAEFNESIPDPDKTFFSAADEDADETLTH